MNHKRTPRRPTRLAPAALLTALILLNACGGDDQANPPATSAAVPNTPPETVLPPSTTTPATTVAPTAPSTVPPTTGPVDEEATKQAVIAAAENAWSVFNEAKLDPSDEAKVGAALAVYTGDALERVEQIILEYRAGNLRSVTSDVSPANVDVNENSVSVDLVSGSAQLELCNVGSNVLVETAGNADGTDRVIDDSITAYYTREQYVLTGGGWLKSDSVVVDEFEGSAVCGS